jgi:hypothetical protein
VAKRPTLAIMLSQSPEAEAMTQIISWQPVNDATSHAKIGFQKRWI